LITSKTILKNACQDPGNCTIVWDGTGETGSPVDPGIYLGLLQTGKAVLMRLSFQELQAN